MADESQAQPEDNLLAARTIAVADGHRILRDPAIGGDGTPQNAEARSLDMLAARAIASHSMEGDVHRRTTTEAEIVKSMNINMESETNIKNFTLELARQRQLAEAAMEGPERKKAREAEELEKRVLVEAIKRQKEETERVERLKKEESSELERITNEARARQTKVLLEKKTTVDELLKTPSMSIRPVRTYKDDMGLAMKDGNLSLVGMAIKEDEKRRATTEEAIETEKKSHWFAIFSVILFLAGVGIGGYVLYTKFLNVPTSVEQSANSGYVAPVFSENVNTVPINDSSATQLIAELKSDVRNLSAPIGTIQAERLINNTTDNTDITFQKLVTVLKLHAPASLVRNVKPEFMLGIHSTAESNAFFYLEPINYEAVFAGMLEWEPALMRDLYGILAGKTLDESLSKLKFTDLIIKNVDARAIKDANNKTIFMYAFFNQKTLIITANETTFTEILTRLTTPKPRTRK